MSLSRARTRNESVDWIRQAVFAGSMSAGMMPEKGAMNIAVRVSIPAPRLEG
jgi:hypothetical protein